MSTHPEEHKPQSQYANIQLREDLRECRGPGMVSDDEAEESGTDQGLEGTHANTAVTNAKTVEVIVISSDDDEVSPAVMSPLANHLTQSRRRRQTRNTGNIIDLTLSSSDSDSPARCQIIRQGGKATPEDPITTLPAFVLDPAVDFVENQSPDSFDESILLLNEPRSSRKPIRIAGKRPAKALVTGHPSGYEDASLRVANATEHRTIATSPISPSARSGTSALRLLSASSPVSTPTRTAKKGGRLTKKALLVAEQARREAYAQELFTNLNKTVFRGSLPSSTALNWNNRLLTTAGRAKWHKSRDGIETAAIELATKVLDSDERIRNTLSHEMCHLACWIIDGKITEGHGQTFKAWASRVTRKYPDIEVTTRHHYEIKHPYEWKCENCAKIYGRFSKSIRADECRCGACKVGRLQPLFKVSTPRTPSKKSSSQMASTEVQGSPRAMSILADILVDLEIGPVSGQSALAMSTEPHFDLSEVDGCGHAVDQADSDDDAAVEELIRAVRRIEVRS